MKRGRHSELQVTLCFLNAHPHSEELTMKLSAVLATSLLLAAPDQRPGAVFQ